MMAYPDMVTDSLTAYMDVYPAFDNLELGRVHLWSKELARKQTRAIKYLLRVHEEAFIEHAKRVLKDPASCK